MGSLERGGYYQPLNILIIQKDQKILVQVEFSYDPPSPRCPTSRPLLRDPLDSKYTKVVKTISKRAASFIFLKKNVVYLGVAQISFDLPPPLWHTDTVPNLPYLGCQVGPSKLGGEVEEGLFEVGEEVFKVGEGLFAAIDLPKATTVCLYSGLTMTKVGEQSMSRYS